MTNEVMCPRRFENPVGAERVPAPDVWTVLDGDRRCSYCGSAHPEDVLAAMSNGAPVIPTDKNYKIYFGDDRRKFYFQHFSEEQQRQFIDLYNEKRLNVGTPGYFYVLPFFCSLPAPMGAE